MKVEQAAVPGQRIKDASKDLTRDAVAKLRHDDWFRALPATDQATLGNVIELAIHGFVAWWSSAEPPDAGQVLRDISPATARMVSFAETVHLIQVVVEVAETAIPLLADTEIDRAAVSQAILVFSRDLGFAVAGVYARIAEERGSSDARLQTQILHALASGTFDQDSAGQARLLQWNPEAPAQALLVRDWQPVEATLRSLQKCAATLRVAVLAGVVEGEVIAVADPSDAVALRERLATLDPEVIIVTTDVAATFLTMHHVLRDGLSALRAARLLPGLASQVRPRDVLAERVLLGDARACAELVETTISLLHEDFVHTLWGFFQAGGSVQQAARTLQVHPNTVRYRLGRIAERCGWDVTTPHGFFTLRVAAALAARDEPIRR